MDDKNRCKKQSTRLYLTTKKTCIAWDIMKSLFQFCNSAYMLKQELPATINMINIPSFVIQV